MKSSLTKFGLRLILTVVILGFILRAVDLSLFWQTINIIKVRWILLAVLLFYPSQILAVYRWDFVLHRVQQQVPFFTLIRTYILGQFTALFLPGQISGDVVRTFATMNSVQNRGALIISIIIDRLSFFAVLTLFAGCGLLVTRRLPYFYNLAWINLTLFILSIFALIVSTKLNMFPRQGWMNTLAQSQRKSATIGLKIMELLRNQNNFPLSGVGVILGISMLLQLLNAFGSYALARGLDFPIQVFDWIFISSIVGLVQVIPITIGGIGIREGVLVSILASYSIAPSQAVFYSLFGFVLIALLNAIGWVIVDSLAQTHQ